MNIYSEDDIRAALKAMPEDGEITVTSSTGSVGKINRTVKVIDEAELHKARHAGRRAKAMRFARISPYYECPPLDHYWFAGYDGLTWDEAVAGK